MNILSIGNLNNLKYLNNPNTTNGKFRPHFGLKFSQPIQCDTVSFKAKQVFADVMRVKQPNRLKRLSANYLDNLAAIAEKFKDRGVSFCREYSEINSIKSEDSCGNKIARSNSIDIRDLIRGTLFMKDITDMKLLNEILQEFEDPRELVLYEDLIPIEDMIARGYIPKKNDGDTIKVPDLDIRLDEGRENIIDLPENLRLSWSRPQKSGYEDIQMRLVRSYDDPENPVKHELIILTGENYAIAKHREYKGVYSITRKLDTLSLAKNKDDKNPHLRLVKASIDMIKQWCSLEISQKLFKDAKNKDILGIDSDSPISISKKDIETLKKYFEQLRKNIESYYTNALEAHSNNNKLQNQIKKEKKRSLELVESIEQELLTSVKKVNKGKYPRTMDELIIELKKEKEKQIDSNKIK